MVKVSESLTEREKQIIGLLLRKGLDECRRVREIPFSREEYLALRKKLGLEERFY